jgi:hypothetical protein
MDVVGVTDVPLVADPLLARLAAATATVGNVARPVIDPVDVEICFVAKLYVPGLVGAVTPALPAP